MAARARLHLIKLCVGADGPDDPAAWQDSQRQRARALGRPERVLCTTRNRPRRADELLDGGSLYWVFRGLVLARQRIIGFVTVEDETGPGRCGIALADPIIRTHGQPCRPFQGWRYLTAGQAPDDLADGAADAEATLPADLQVALAELGVTRRRA